MCMCARHHTCTSREGGKEQRHESRERVCLCAQGNRSTHAEQTTSIEHKHQTGTQDRHASTEWSEREKGREISHKDKYPRTEYAHRSHYETNDFLRFVSDFHLRITLTHVSSTLGLKFVVDTVVQEESVTRKSEELCFFFCKACKTSLAWPLLSFFLLFHFI